MIKLFLFTIISILLLTLFPYDFYGMEHFSSFSVLWSKLTLLQSDFLQDFAVNILLFLPFGFALASMLANRKLSSALRVCVIAFMAAILSSSIEFSQLYLPSRVASLYDVLANTMGAVLGGIVYYYYGSSIIFMLNKIGSRLFRYLKPKHLAIAVFVYMVMFFLFTSTLDHASSFETWQSSYTLLLGNEKGGGRPWRGIVQRFSIIDQALSVTEVKSVLNNHFKRGNTEPSIGCFYDFSTSNPLEDKSGHLPDLTWHSNAGEDRKEKEFFLGPNHWLQCEKPVESLVQRIQSTNQFSIFIVLATADTVQTGPARILSLSSGPYHRDFTLAQDRKDLIFRLRTPLTGENGNEPEFIARNVFLHTDMQELFVTFDGKRLRLYVDGKANKSTMLFSQGAMFFKKVFKLNFYEMRGYAFLYDFLFIAPLLALLCIVFFSRTYAVKISDMNTSKRVRKKA